MTKLELIKQQIEEMKKDISKIPDWEKNIIPEIKRLDIPKDMPEHSQYATESPIVESDNPFEDTAAAENNTQETLKLDEYDLRLNKIIRLIVKTEESLKKNNMEDAKISYSNLKTAYNAAYKKVPEYQIDEIRPKIERLENLLKKR